MLYSEQLTGDGQKMFDHAAKLNWEVIVSKRADAPYRSERTEAWLKIKTVQRKKFCVIGFVNDPTGVAALYLGKRERKELVYMGKRRFRKACVFSDTQRVLESQYPQIFSLD